MEQNHSKIITPTNAELMEEARGFIATQRLAKDKQRQAALCTLRELVMAEQAKARAWDEFLSVIGPMEMETAFHFQNDLKAMLETGRLAKIDPRDLTIADLVDVLKFSEG